MKVDLGWLKINCIFVELDELDCELAEIDENLFRAELSPAEEAQHLQRRKEIFEAKRSGESIPTSRFNKGFDADTTDKTGQDKSAVRKNRTRAQKSAPDVMEEIKGTDIDKGVELDALKDLTPEEQRQAVAREAIPMATQYGYGQCGFEGYLGNVG